MRVCGAKGFLEGEPAAMPGNRSVQRPHGMGFGVKSRYSLLPRETGGRKDYSGYSASNWRKSTEDEIYNGVPSGYRISRVVGTTGDYSHKLLNKKSSYTASAFQQAQLRDWQTYDSGVYDSVYVRTKASSYSPSSYTKETVAAKVFQPAVYSASKYMESNYTKEAYSYTASMYTKESIDVVTKKYVPSSHSYTASSYTESSFTQYSETHTGNPSITTYSSTGVKVFTFPAGYVSGGSKGSLTLSASSFTSGATIAYQPGWYDSSGLRNIGGIPYIPKAAIHTGYLKIGNTTFDGDNGYREGYYTPGSAGIVSGGGGAITITPAAYSASSYIKETHSYAASAFREPTVAELNAGDYIRVLNSYTESSYTKETHSYTASSYTKESYTASTYTAAQFRNYQASDEGIYDKYDVRTAASSYSASAYTSETTARKVLQPATYTPSSYTEETTSEERWNYYTYVPSSSTKQTKTFLAS